MPLSRRSALILPLAAALPGRARAAMSPITDALGRTIQLRAPAERIVLRFNFEAFTAVAGPAGWATLPALRNGELHAVETGLARSLWDWKASQYIAKQLHPAAFADVDPMAELRRYHKRFLPVAFEGTWTARLT